MKKLILIALVISTTASAGTCSLNPASREAGKLPFAGSNKPDLIGRTSLEECVRFAHDKIGSVVTMSTLIRRERRTITEVKYIYSDEHIHSEGNVYRKSH